MISPFIAALVITLCSFSALIFITKKAKNWLFKNIKFLITFTAGIFLMTALGLASESFHHLSSKEAIMTIIGGFLFMWILHTIIPETHHHHDDTCPDCVPSNKGTKLLIGDAIHNIADGIVLASAFSVSIELGLVATISIFIHEFVQEISKFFVLRQSGYSTKKSLLWNFLSEMTVLLGVAIGLFLISNSSTEAVLLGLSSGIFLHIVFHDLFPYESVKKIKESTAWKHIFLFALGILLVILLGYFFPHEL